MSDKNKIHKLEFIKEIGSGSKKSSIEKLGEPKDFETFEEKAPAKVYSKRGKLLFAGSTTIIYFAKEKDSYIGFTKTFNGNYIGYSCRILK